MSDNWDDDVDDFTDEPSGRGDSEGIRALRKQFAQLKKQLEKTQSENTALKAAGRGRAIKDVLADRGVSAQLARFIEKDIEGEVTADAVNKWLDDNGEVFGLSKPEPQAPAGLTAEDVAAMQQIGQSTQGDLTLDRYKQQMEAIKNATTKEELDTLLANG